jgi:hypothetical protein
LRRAHDAAVTTDTSLDWMISVDDHVIEPPGVWQDRVPARYSDVAPRMVEEGDDEYWVYENRRGNAQRVFEFMPAPFPSGGG